MRAFLLAPCVLGLFGVFAQADADDESRAIIQKAIQAHGGKDKLSQTKAEIVSTRGTMQIPKIGSLPLTGESYAQLPGQFKAVVRTEFQGQAIVLVQMLDGERASVSVNGIGQPVPPRLLDELKEARFAENAQTLTPLLEGKAYRVTALKEENIKGRPAVGILVQAPGHKDYRMYFDKARGLLVKTERRALNHAMQDVLQESFWDDFKETAGITRPRRFLVTHDGQVQMQGEITEVRYADTLLADTFAGPR
jgi:hypothetical protein